MIQSFAKLNIPMNQYGVDAASISLYKIGSVSKIAALVVHKDLKTIICKHSLINTVHIQHEQHSGTLNLGYVTASLRALKIITLNRKNKNHRLIALK